MTETGKIDNEVLKQAAEWFATLNDPAVTPREKADWQAWLKSDFTHEQAWARVGQIDGLFPGLPKQEARDVLQAADKKRKYPAKGIMGMLVLLPLLWLAGLLQWPEIKSQYDYHTATGQLGRFTLAEGTEVWLNTDSAMNVDYNPSERRLTLVKGEALVNSAPDNSGRQRPLIVATADGRVMAIGTRFSVRRHAEKTVVHVFAGEVNVFALNGDAPVAVAAGGVAEFNQQEIVKTGAAGKTRAAWVKGLLIADNTPLCDFMRELERYLEGGIDCPAGVANLKLVGVYPLQDKARIFAAIQASLPVRIRRQGGNYLVIPAEAQTWRPGLE